ncbi:NAD(P)-dependent oxidoreductase [Polaromonas sp. P1(28)-13]|nr:NAD(P)-dependent oxidoreductase [Polaromonas sp. P1(28)-13]
MTTDAISPRFHRILVTGAAGNLAGVLRPGLAAAVPQLRLTDVRGFTAQVANEEVVIADLRDLEAAKSVMQGVDCVIHLAGYPQNAGWEHLRAINIDVTYNVFEAARQSGVKRVVFASTNRVVSFYPSAQAVHADMPARPDGLYGVTKIFGETLGRLYSDQYGLSVACVRIGAFRPTPEIGRHLSNWVSPADLLASMLACVQAQSFRFLVFFAVSGNTRKN